MNNFLRATFIIVQSCLFLAPLPALGLAVANAQMHGSVQDGSGAMIPGAQIRAIKTETGQMRSTRSGTDASYVFPDLAVGSYRLEVSAPSFGNYVQSGICCRSETMSSLTSRYKSDL